VELLAPKVPYHASILSFYFSCAVSDAKYWRNSIMKIFEKTLVIKVSKSSFSKLRVKKILYKA
jgi:hypothetical protein